MDLKKLYLGSSMSELNKKAIYDFDSNRGMKIHINHSDKTFQAAEEARLKGDQERAYVLYMRYSDIFQKVRNSKEYKKDASHYSLLLGAKKIREAIQQAEELSKSLKMRYDDTKIIKTDNLDDEHIKERTPLSPKSINLANKNGFKQESVNVVPEKISSPLSKEVKTVSSEKLYELLFNNPVTDYSVLMIDIRTTSDFTLSCIRHPNCINISKDILTPGIVCKKIDPKMENLDHLEKWKNRAMVDVLVLIDWYANEKRLNDVQDPLRCLNDALVKWEQEIFLKRDPVLLNGGYADWLDYYPQFTTNSKVERPQIKPRNVTSVTSLTDFSFRGLIPQMANGSTNDETAVDETDLEKENWDSAEIIADVNASKSTKTAEMPSSHMNEFEATVSTPSSSLYPAVPHDITLGSNKTVNVHDVINDASKPTIPTSPMKDDKAKKSIPAVDRTKKPTMPSRDLKPRQTLDTSDVKNDKPVAINFDNWPAFSEIASIEKPKPASNFDEEYAQIMGRTEANRKRMEEEDRKLKDLEEKKKLAQAQALERKMLQEAEEKELKRKAAEKELANAMREINKAKKPSELLTTTEQESETVNKTATPASNGTSEKPALDKPQPLVRRDNKPVAVVSEKKDVVTEMQDVSIKDLKVNEPKSQEPASPTSNQLTNNIEKNVSTQKPIVQPPSHSAAPQRDVAKQDPPQELKVEPPNHGKTSQKVVAKQDTEQKPAVKPSTKPSSTAPPKSLIKTDDTKENAKLKPKPVVITSSPRELPQPKKSASNIERKGASNLPINWEKRLDRKTGRYFYLNHTTKTTHWELPNDVRVQISKVPLKNDAATSSGSLKRSSSTPNIAQLVENENADALVKAKPSVPNRGNKPSTAQVPTTVPDSPDEYARNLARLNPEMGGPGPGRCGLRNLGNTCYMNSVLQCMFNTAYLARYFLTNSYKQYINRENFLGSRGEITEGFALLMKATWEGRYRNLTPKDFRYTISKFNSRFYTYTQQDSQELLLFLMDGLHEDLNEIKERMYIEEKDDDGKTLDKDAALTSWKNHSRLNKSVIVTLFQGQFKATVRCLHCNKTSRKFDVFMYLSLPIPSSGNCSINDCVRKFSEDEKLSGDNKWRCPGCKTERNAVRKMEIWKLPTVLLIHFKRFSFSGRWGDKVQTSVKFPENNLDLNNFVKGPEKRKLYQLYSVSHHYGATLDSGHYVASCKSPVDHNWYKYDDHEVSRTSVPQGPSAYILCYTSLSHSLELV